VKIYPIGYSAYGAQKYIDELLQDPKILLIDTRYIPYSWRTDYRQEALKAKYGDKYKWAGEYLGNIAKDYGYIRIADMDTGIRGLMYYFGRGYDLILLCACASYADCHVSNIVDHLQQLLIVEVVRYGIPEMKLASLGKDAKEVEPERITVCARTVKSKSNTTWAKGDKVTCSIPWCGDVHGVVREVKTEGTSQKVRLRTSVHAPLLSKYIVSNDPRWFDVDCLKPRVNTIAELGEY
jgi:hypothetical protein